MEKQPELIPDENGVNLCKCNKCLTIMIDQNPQIGAKTYSTENIKTEDMQYVSEDGAWVCPICETDDYLIDP